MHFSLMASGIIELGEMGADGRVFLIQMYIISSLLLQFLHSPLGTKLGTMAWAACFPTPRVLSAL